MASPTSPRADANTIARDGVDPPPAGVDPHDVRPEPLASDGEVRLDPTPPRPVARPSIVRTLVPFAVAAVLLWFLARRVDRAAFVGAIASLEVGPFVAFVAAWGTALLAADALGNRAAYRAAMPSVRWRDFFVFRGASYLPAVVNHHLGQAYMTFLFAKLARVSLVRMAGATLVAYVTWIGCLVACVALALPLTDVAGRLVFTGVGLGAGLGYLGLLAVRPAALARTTLLAPLFEAGVEGHLRAMLARLPHLAVLVLGNWGAFAFFDVRIPAGVALVYLPILLVATTLPITPQGFGTRDTAAQLFFTAHALGATHEERTSRLAACTLVWGVGQMLIAVVLGALCSRVVDARLRATGDAPT
jgi:hypothetical protein